MYGQFQNSSSSAAKWVAIAFFVVLLMAILFGLNLNDATWLNPNIANSEAYRIRLDAEHQRALDQLDEQLKAAQNEAAIKEIQRQQTLLDAQYEHNIQAMEQDLAHSEVAFQTWMAVLTILGGALALALCISTTIWVCSRAWVYIQSNSQKENAMTKNIPPVEKWIPNLPERKPYDPWMDPEYRRQQRIAAQQRELKEREENKTIATRIKWLSNTERVSKSKYNNLPIAGD